MQEILLSALIAYQTSRDLGERVPPPSHRAFILNQYRASTPHMARRTYRGAGKISSTVTTKPPSRRKVTLKTKKKSSVRKTLVIAPHPDDEVICCAALMGQRIKEGESVKVVYLTDGDALKKSDSRASKAYGRARRQESIRAMAMMGLTKNHLYFLNFPDGSLDQLGDSVYRSPYTLQAKAQKATHFNHTHYTRPHLTKNIRRLIQNYKPDEIYIPSQVVDHHPDHQTAGALLTEIFQTHPSLQTKVWAYAVHTHQALEPDQETDEAKLDLLRVFKSQFHDKAHTDFMEGFANKKEQFSLLEKKKNVALKQ